MKLSLEQVDKITALARLELSEEERAAFARQLSSIIEYVDKLQAVDTKDVEPMSHSVAMGNVLREDEAVDCDPGSRLKMIEAFPEKEGDLLKVKAVFS